MQMKKPAWSSMPVLDVRKLTETQLSRLAKRYDTISKRSLAPICHLDDDAVRQEIDSEICAIFNAPDLEPIRTLLAREPGLSAHDMNSHGENDNDDEEETDEE
jgi:hypothetical protein